MQGVHLWHTARPKLIARFQQLERHIFPAQRALGSYCSKFESVWMTLADSTVAQRQALGTICAGRVSCNTHTSDFRTTQEAVGTVLGPPKAMDCIWHNQCRLKASGGDQLAAKAVCLPQLVLLGSKLSCTKAPCLGLPSGSQSLHRTGWHVAKSNWA